MNGSKHDRDRTKNVLISLKKTSWGLDHRLKVGVLQVLHVASVMQASRHASFDCCNLVEESKEEYLCLSLCWGSKHGIPEFCMNLYP